MFSTTLNLSQVIAAACAAEVAQECPVAPRTVLPLEPRDSRGADVPHICVVLPSDPADERAALLVSHAQWLAANGFSVTVRSHAQQGGSSDVRWTTVAWGQNLTDGLPWSDVILVATAEQAARARSQGIAPVLHLEQGDPRLQDHLSEDDEAHLRAVLAAADVTLAVTPAIRRVLSERFARESALLPVPLEPPAPAVADESPVSGGTTARVVVHGWDGDFGARVPVARRAVQQLRAAGRDVTLAWATPRWPVEPAAEGEEMVLASEDRADLVDLFRGADVFVSPGLEDDPASKVLDAMACGVPVVAARWAPHEDEADDGNEGNDGNGALTVSPDDVDALAAAIARVLDDADLATRLRTAGQVTAAAHTADAVGAALAGQLRTLAAQTISTSSTIEDWKIDVRSVTLDGGPEALEELARRLVTVTTGSVALPVSRPAFEGHRLVRWAVVARRKGAGGTTRILLPAHSEAPDRTHPWHEGIKALSWQRSEQAVRFFVNANRNARDEQAALLWRWVSLSALESGRHDDALDGATSALEAWPDNPDYHYLSAVMALLAGQEVDVAAALHNVEAIGAPYRYDEWFEDTAGLLARRMPPAALARPA